MSIEVAILYLIITLAAAFCAGWFAREYSAKLAIDKMYRELANQIKAHPRLIVKLTREGEMIYVYNAETDEFIAQGKTSEEIDSQIRARFPNHTVHALSVENLREVGYRK